MKIASFKHTSVAPSAGPEVITAHEGASVVETQVTVAAQPGLGTEVSDENVKVKQPSVAAEVNGPGIMLFENFSLPEVGLI